MNAVDKLNTIVTGVIVTIGLIGLALYIHGSIRMGRGCDV